MSIDWSTNLETAKRILGHYKPTELEAAAEAVGETIGAKVTVAALRRAFNRRSEGPLTRWMFGGGPLSDRTDLPEHERQLPQQAVAKSWTWGFELTEEDRDTEPAPPPETDLVDRILAAVKFRPLDYPTLSDKLNVPTPDIKRAVQEAITSGFDLRINDGHVSRAQTRGNIGKVAGWNDYVGRHLVAIVSDTHIGNMWAAEEELTRFIRWAYGLGVRTVIHPGDILDGFDHKLIPEQDLVGFDRQSLRATQVFPALDGLQYFAHTGNHDEHTSSSCGFDSGRGLENRFREVGRHDWHHVGRCNALIRVESAEWELNHPHGGTGSNAGVIGVLEGIINERDHLPHFELTGHFHKYVTGIRKGCHMIGCATWQRKGSPFSNRIKGPWAVGGVLVEYDALEDGSVDAVSTRFVSADRFAVAA
jgi:predicted phosphodiesterase